MSGFFFKGLNRGHLENLGRPLRGIRSSRIGDSRTSNGNGVTVGLPQHPRPMTLWEVAMLEVAMLAVMAMGQQTMPPGQRLTRHHQGQLDLRPVQDQVLPASFVWKVSPATQFFLPCAHGPFHHHCLVRTLAATNQHCPICRYETGQAWKKLLESCGCVSFC